MNATPDISSAVALFRSKKFRDSSSMAEAILENEPNNTQAMHVVARAALALKEYDRAAEWFSRLPVRSFNAPVLLAEYGCALRMSGQPRKSLEVLESCIADHYAVLVERGLAYVAAAEPEAARVALEGALKHKPDSVPVLRELAKISAVLDETHEFIHICEKLLSLRSGDVGLYPALITAYLRSAMPEKALQLCNEMISKSPNFVAMYGFKCLALSELGKVDELNYLTDYGVYLRRFSLDELGGVRPASNFNDLMLEHIRCNAKQTSHQEKYTTYNGWQTEPGELFGENRALEEEFNGYVREALGQYISRIPDDPDHPVRLTRPENYNIDSWAVVLNREGHQGAHIHGGSWVSGVYYVKLPGDPGQQAGKNAGCIEFGRGKEELYPLKEPTTRILRPVEGEFIMFPAYFWHNTIPLESSDDRICVAFNLAPAEARVVR